MKRWHLIVILLFGLGIGYSYFSKPKTPRTLALQNYGESFKTLSRKHKLPWGFLMALNIVECQGQKPCPSSYDNAVYQELKKVRSKEQLSFQDIQHHHVGGATDEALKELATAWGPFQIMGYRLVNQGITVSQIQSKEGTDFSVAWLNKVYGNRLRKHEFQDVFHLHGHGTPFPKDGKPKTDDPEYVFSGLDHIEWFKKKSNESTK